MSMVPATPVLPADMLRPADIVLKFAPRSLAGLGDWEIDADGNPVFIDSGGVNTITDLTPAIPWLSAGGTAADVQEGGTYLPPSGANPTQVFIPSTVSRSSSGGIDTSARDAATANLVNTLVRAGFSLAQVAAMQPGTVIQTGPGGTSTVLRQSAPGQSPVPVTLFGGGVSAAANQGGLLMLVALGVGALFLFSRR